MGQNSRREAKRKTGKKELKLVWLLFIFIRDGRRGQRERQENSSASRRRGGQQEEPLGKIPAKMFPEGREWWLFIGGSSGFGLGTLINSSMGTNPRRGAAEVQNFGRQRAEVGSRTTEEGIYFGDRDHVAGRTSGAILLNGPKLKPACFLPESQRSLQILTVFEGMLTVPEKVTDLFGSGWEVIT